MIYPYDIHICKWIFIIRNNYGYLCLLWILMSEVWISIFVYEYLEFITIVDIHNLFMETIIDIHSSIMDVYICQLKSSAIHI